MVQCNCKKEKTKTRERFKNERKLEEVHQIVGRGKLLGTIMMGQKSEDEDALFELEAMDFHLELAIDALKLN